MFSQSFLTYTWKAIELNIQGSVLGKEHSLIYCVWPKQKKEVAPPNLLPLVPGPKILTDVHSPRGWVGDESSISDPFGPFDYLKMLIPKKSHMVKFSKHPRNITDVPLHAQAQLYRASWIVFLCLSAVHVL